MLLYRSVCGSVKRPKGWAKTGKDGSSPGEEMFWLLARMESAIQSWGNAGC